MDPNVDLDFLYQNYLDYSDDMTKKEEAFDYLQQALVADTDEERIELCKRALEVNPDMLEAETVILRTSGLSGSELQKKMKSLLDKAERRLEKLGINRQEDAGMYYDLPETDSFIMVYREYMDLLVEISKLRKAAEVGENILYLNEDDDLEARFDLLAIYAVLEEQRKAQELFEVYEMKSSARALMTMSMLYYKLDLEKKAVDYLKKLMKMVPDIQNAFKVIDEDPYLVNQELNFTDVTENSANEILLEYIGHPFLHEPTSVYVSWALENMQKLELKKSKTKKKGKQTAVPSGKSQLCVLDNPKKSGKKKK